MNSRVCTWVQRYRVHTIVGAVELRLILSVWLNVIFAEGKELHTSKGIPSVTFWFVEADSQWLHSLTGRRAASIVSSVVVYSCVEIADSAAPVYRFGFSPLVSLSSLSSLVLKKTPSTQPLPIETFSLAPVQFPFFLTIQLESLPRNFELHIYFTIAIFFFSLPPALSILFYLPDRTVRAGSRSRVLLATPERDPAAERERERERERESSLRDFETRRIETRYVVRRLPSPPPRLSSSLSRFNSISHTNSTGRHATIQQFIFSHHSSFFSVFS